MCFFCYKIPANFRTFVLEKSPKFHFHTYTKTMYLRIAGIYVLNSFAVIDGVQLIVC